MTVSIGRCPVLLNKLIFDKFTPFRCPLVMGSVRPPVFSEVRLDAEFFRCRLGDPVIDVKLTGFVGVVHVAFFGE